MPTRVVISDRQVAGLTAFPGGIVYDWVFQQGKIIARDARRKAPVRTGNLKRRISSRITRANGKSTRVQIRCSAPYAEYVHNGTGGRAWSISGDGPGGWMRLYTQPMNAAGAAAAGYIMYFGAFMQQVDGQEASPFIADAFETWALTHGFKTKIRGPLQPVKF